MHADVPLYSRAVSRRAGRSPRRLCLRLRERVPLPDERRATADQGRGDDPTPPAAAFGMPLRSGDAFSALRHRHSPFRPERKEGAAALAVDLTNGQILPTIASAR